MAPGQSSTPILRTSLNTSSVVVANSAASANTNGQQEEANFSQVSLNNEQLY